MRNAICKLSASSSGSQLVPGPPRDVLLATVLAHMGVIGIMFVMDAN